MWSVPREWEGETAFIVASGPSVTQGDVDRLKGRKVIVINSSYTVAPWADILFFGDCRWWMVHRDAALKLFRGRIVTSSRSAPEVPKGMPRLLRLDKVEPEVGLSRDPRKVAMKRTSLQAAINLAVHLGVSRIVLLGADGKPSADGRTHHHAPHQWPVRPENWEEQAKQLALTRKPLKKLRIGIVNCSPGTALTCFPTATLDSALDVQS